MTEPAPLQPASGRLAPPPVPATPPGPPARGRPASTGDNKLDARIESLLDELGVTANRDQLRELLVSVVRLAQGHPDRLDLKIVNAALREMLRGLRGLRPLPRGAQDHHVRFCPHPTDRSPVRPGPRPGFSPGGPGLVDGDRRRARDHGGRSRRRRPRALVSGSTSACPSSKTPTSSSLRTQSWSR